MKLNIYLYYSPEWNEIIESFNYYPGKHLDTKGLTLGDEEYLELSEFHYIGKL